MVVAWLAIAGVPPFSGFFSKDEILSQAFLATTTALWVIGIVGAAFTAVYMTRLIWLTFFGNERFEALPTSDRSGGSGETAVAEETTDTNADATCRQRSVADGVATATRWPRRSGMNRTSRRRS